MADEDEEAEGMSTFDAADKNLFTSEDEEE
jgi:hypothetical protein